ncbi:hypothetical protein [Bacillus sp. AFS088145]|uniref:hypothetical protein n=1 Tax=Bacillus sp. AFS088145 TaxID=2033514 RepID=UPI000BF54241|nr:hypothetical protein [Bacillus sp. AFS088145]PFH91390.1 hypothetical protein COI44_01940 [Bacillus sp. AFS088145]
MTRFIDRFENHTLHNSLQTNINLVESLLEKKENDSNIIIELERIKQVLFHLKGILGNCDPNLVYIGYLDTLDTNCLNNIFTYLNYFRNEHNITHLHTANNHLDSYITSMTSVTTTIFPQDVDGIKDSVISFRRSAAQHLRHMEDEYNKLEAAKSELEQGFSEVAVTVENQKARLDTAISDFQQQFSSAEDSRRNKFTQSEDQRKSSFELTEKDWNANFQDLLETTDTKLQSFLISLNKKGNDLQENYHNQGEVSLQLLEEYKIKAAKLLNIISNTSMAGGYKQVADQEKSSLKFWRWVTMIAMILLVGASIYSFFVPIGDLSIWTAIVKRISIAATLATVAGYASRQAKVHLDAERRYRRMELELTTLSPYLVELDDDQRKDILAKMAEQFFGNKNDEPVQNNASNQANQEFTSSVDISKLIELLSSFTNKK